MKYRVLIDDNFHFMDESARYEHGQFDTAEAAAAACKRIVDECLASAHSPGMAAADLLQVYRMSGEDPWIAGGDQAVKFSAWDYAATRVLEICR